MRVDLFRDQNVSMEHDLDLDHDSWGDSESQIAQWMEVYLRYSY
jgi:hypothetical protein